MGAKDHCILYEWWFLLMPLQYSLPSRPLLLSCYLNQFSNHVPYYEILPSNSARTCSPNYIFKHSRLLPAQLRQSSTAHPSNLVFVHVFPIVWRCRTVRLLCPTYCALPPCSPRLVTLRCFGFTNLCFGYTPPLFVTIFFNNFLLSIPLVFINSGHDIEIFNGWENRSTTSYTCQILSELTVFESSTSSSLTPTNSSSYS